MSQKKQRQAQVILAGPTGVELPLVVDGAPNLIVSPAVAAQPYRLVMIGEKSSLCEVLLPIAEEIGTELLLPTGEASDVMIYNMAAGAAEDAARPKLSISPTLILPVGRCQSAAVPSCLPCVTSISSTSISKFTALR